MVEDFNTKLFKQQERYNNRIKTTMNDIYFARKFYCKETGEMLWYKKLFKSFNTELAANNEARFLQKVGAHIKIVENKPNKWYIYFRN